MSKKPEEREIPFSIRVLFAVCISAVVTTFYQQLLNMSNEGAMCAFILSAILPLAASYWQDYKSKR